MSLSLSPLVSWVRCGTCLYRFLIFAPYLFCEKKAPNFNIGGYLDFIFIYMSHKGFLMGPRQVLFIYLFLFIQYLKRCTLLAEKAILPSGPL